jgi:tetratricopeptide (TPR) repeat protein
MDWLSRFTEWANGLQTKDRVTIYISAVALGVSIISFYISVRQKRREDQRTLRSQLMDILAKIVLLNLEDAKLPPPGMLPSGTPSNIKAFFNDQRRVLVRQAVYIIGQMKPPPGSFEYLMIAVTYDNIDDVNSAKRYFETALQRAEDDINRGIITRSYARFCFSQGEYDSARERYGKAVEIFSGDSDRMKENRGETYYRWAKSEFERGFLERADGLFKLSRENFESKSNIVTRERSLALLDHNIRQLKSARPSDPGENILPGQKQRNGDASGAGKGVRPRRKH